MKTPRSAGAVGIRVPEDGGRAGFAGLTTCGSVWACPVCAAKIGAERAREEITPVVRHVIDDMGGSVVHATFTVQHHQGQPLAVTRRAVQRAWEHVTSARRWRVIDREFDRAGFCRAFEATWGKANGWHPHLHVLLFLARPITGEECTRLSELLYELYRAGLAKAGFDCTELHGVRAELATTRRDADVVLGRYLTKIASEITRNDRKTARGDRYTPFDLLREAVEQGNADALDRWQEWEQATAGARQLTWSRGWRGGPCIRTRAGVRGERSDEEIAAGEERDPVVVQVENAEWTRRSVWRKRTDVLNAAEAAGAVGVAAFLTAHGIAWSSPHPDVNTPGWRADLAVMTELYRRNGRMVLPSGTRYDPRHWLGRDRAGERLRSGALAGGHRLDGGPGDAPGWEDEHDLGQWPAPIIAGQ